MATIRELLNARWNEKETTEAIMAIRVAFQNLKSVADQTKFAVDAVLAGSSFASVHANLKAEGQACITILNQLRTALGNHAEFIDFQPDQV